MLTFTDALEKILQHSHPLRTTVLPLSEALGAILAVDIKAREPIPRFDSSAVDGYAVRSEDLCSTTNESPVALALQGLLCAGDLPTTGLKHQSTIKVFTGAPIPRNANAVVMQEDTKEENGFIIFHANVKTGQNIRRRGEEFGRGDRIFSSGTIITPPVIGMLATVGYSRVRVYQKPRVALIVTGNELREPATRLRVGEIRDANSFALRAVLQAVGITPVLNLRVKDNPRAIHSAFAQALRRADVVVSTGGVSVGDYDFVKDVLSDLGVTVVFWKVAMKPGKPFLFGVKQNRLLFGLPGNPVSALLSFHLLVKPAIRTLMGMKVTKPHILKATLGTDLVKKRGRREFIRANVSPNDNGLLSVVPTSGQDSHMISGLATANCLLHLPEDAERIAKGSLVDVELLYWNEL